MPGQLTTEERDHAIRVLEENAAEFARAFGGIPEARWTVKASPEQWSPAELAEHITLLETRLPILLGRRLLQSEERPLTPEIRAFDAEIATGLERRPGGMRVEAPEQVRPTGRWATKAEALDTFSVYRTKLIEYVRTTDDPLRHHCFPHPLIGDLDGYQWLLFTAGHAKRHIAQLEEIY